MKIGTGNRFHWEVPIERSVACWYWIELDRIEVPKDIMLPRGKLGIGSRLEAMIEICEI